MFYTINLQKDKLRDMFKLWILDKGLYRQSILHPTLPTNALTKNFSGNLIGRRGKVDIMDTQWILHSLQMLKPILRMLALTDALLLFGTSTERYIEMMGFAGIYCDMPHTSDLWRGGSLTNKVQIKKSVDLVFIADISSDVAVYIEAQKLRLPTIFMHHFNSNRLPTYTLPGPINWHSIYFYSKVLSMFVKQIFMRKEIFSETIWQDNSWSRNIFKFFTKLMKNLKKDNKENINSVLPILQKKGYKFRLKNINKINTCISGVKYYVIKRKNNKKQITNGHTKSTKNIKKNKKY